MAKQTDPKAVVNDPEKFGDSDGAGASLFYIPPVEGTDPDVPQRTVEEIFADLDAWKRENPRPEQDEDAGDA